MGIRIKLHLAAGELTNWTGPQVQLDVQQTRDSPHRTEPVSIFICQHDFC